MTTKPEYDKARYLRKKAERIFNSKPDPIHKICDINRAYIAGLIDGEGSIHMTQKIKYGTFYAFVTIGMTDKEVINWLAEKFGNKAVECLRPRGESFKRTPKPIYRVSLQGRRACLLCEILLPFLKVKKKHAEVLLKYPCDARIGPGRKIYGSEINEIRKTLKKELTKLNDYYYQRRHQRPPP